MMLSQRMKCAGNLIVQIFDATILSLEQFGIRSGVPSSFQSMNGELNQGRIILLLARFT